MNDTCSVCHRAIDVEHTCVLLQKQGRILALHTSCAAQYKESERLAHEHSTHTELVEGCPQCEQLYEDLAY